jgi:6-phosphofructokinase 2
MTKTPAIVTLTLSPSLDLATRVAHLCPEAKLRCSEPDFAPGGGGINVARAIHKLGGSALAIFPVWRRQRRAAGQPAECRSRAEHALAGAGRQPASVSMCSSRAASSSIRFVMPAVGLSDSEQDNLLATLTGLQDMDYLVVSGSQPQGLHSDFIPQLLQLAASRGTRCILDSSGQALRQTLDVGGAWLIKPNLAELAELAGSEDIEPEELASDCPATGARRQEPGCSGVPRRPGCLAGDCQPVRAHRRANGPASEHGRRGGQPGGCGDAQAGSWMGLARGRPLWGGGRDCSNHG